MTRGFTIKKEIRSLGIDFCNPEHVIGVVVRGGLYLDGIVTFSPRPKQRSTSIGNAVVQTRFYPELKLIMIHESEPMINGQQVEKITGLPVIDINTRRRTNTNGFETFKVGKRKLYARSSLEAKTVQQVLSLTWTTGSLPEPLRVAHLIAKSRILGKKPAFLG